MAVGALLFQSKKAVTLATLTRPACVGCSVICSIQPVQPRFIPTEMAGASAQTRPATRATPIQWPSLFRQPWLRLCKGSLREEAGRQQELHPTPTGPKVYKFLSF